MAGPRPLLPAPAPEVVAARLEALRVRIADAGRDPSAVRIVAVTKGFDVGAVRAARAAGIDDIGENYAPELLAKAEALLAAEPAGGAGARPGAGVRWHYIGAVQRRRVPALAPVVSWWETVCRVEEGRAIAARASGAVVLVEVDTTDIAGRNGVAPAAVPGLVRALREDGLEVRGLMTVAPPGGGARARAAFRTTARLAAELGLAELSMGMTDDLEPALAEGSTMVRVGRALFGERPPATG
ncbi:MAG TPA: alanine racemase [Acidimicrobiales bacterium]|nr:alanine racemase [Acidimicrobiales bacterium]